MKVEFKHAVNALVLTPFNEKGIVDIAGVDASGARYFVKLAGGNGDWFYEDQLTSA